MTVTHRRLNLAVILALLGALSLSLGAARADARLPHLLRHEDQYWTWYAPKGWHAAQGRAGIDVTSPTGVLHVGYAFSGTPFPVTNADVREYVAENDGLDVHPLANLVFTSLGRPFDFAGGLREIDRYRAFRTDRSERTRGILTTDVWNDYYYGIYGFAGSVINAPRRVFRDRLRLLKRIRSLLLYHPQSPEFAPPHGP